MLQSCTRDASAQQTVYSLQVCTLEDVHSSGSQVHLSGAHVYIISAHHKCTCICAHVHLQRCTYKCARANVHIISARANVHIISVRAHVHIISARAHVHIISAHAHVHFYVHFQSAHVHLESAHVHFLCSKCSSTSVANWCRKHKISFGAALKPLIFGAIFKSKNQWRR